MNVKLAQLRMLVAVADHGNFGKAGLVLDLSQSTVSHGIASLEEELGVVLVQRGRHGAHLTPVGHEVLSYARQMLDLSEAIAKVANTARGLDGGVVQVASFRSFATHILPPILAQFRESYPNVKVNITELSLQQDVEIAVRKGHADIGLLHLPVDEETFEAWEILRDEYRVFTPLFMPSHYSIPADGLTWEAIAQYPIILPPDSDSCGRIVREHFAHYHKPLKVAYEIKEASTTISMVAQGLGFAILANLVAQPIPESVRTHSLPVKLERRAGCVVRRDALHSPAVYAFLEALRSKHIALAPMV
ncbi:MAG: LysR family transcriptional regulator [Leptolyngbyaceae bacterium]|nr:LysR family transcriptional regulator [Leptolyngbyaceae bacterium]